ncbi:Uncharacterised protein [Alistipes sp. cv1]|uniref:hypothetical protein n=1 Tax=Alistipes indistinctus TaxID=626932 RepID=UPI0006C15F87|nr:Uncharacterised protein [Faecalibacterium prausnitzii]
MTWNILQLLFCALPFAVSLALYKSRRRFMARFYERMVRNDKARKLYVRVLLILLLLFHYVYTRGHAVDFGILLSTGVCAVMFSFKRADRWLRGLLDRPRAFVVLGLTASAIGFVPHLYTTAVTASYLLLAALFYPSVRIMSEWSQNDIRRIFEWVKHPETFAESYHDHHHTGLPHDADNGNSDQSAQ